MDKDEDEMMLMTTTTIARSSSGADGAQITGSLEFVSLREFFEFWPRPSAQGNREWFRTKCSPTSETSQGRYTKAPVTANELQSCPYVQPLVLPMLSNRVRTFSPSISSARSSRLRCCGLATSTLRRTVFLENGILCLDRDMAPGQDRILKLAPDKVIPVLEFVWLFSAFSI